MRVDVNEAEGRDWKRMLWLVIGGALLIRVWGTWYGLPFSFYADEYHEVMRALELGTGSFNFDRVTKGGFYLLLFVEYGTYFVLLKLMGVVATAQEFAEEFVRDPSAFYLMGRMTAAVFGTITVAAAFFVARQAYSATAGLLAALFLAVNTLHIDLSRVIGVDVPMTMLATLALYFALRIADSGQRKDYLLAALCAALATTTKLTGIVVLLPLLIAHTYSVANAESGLRGWFGSRNLWLAALVFAGVLVATNPGFLKSAEFIKYLFSSPANDVMDEAMLSAVAELGSTGARTCMCFTCLQSSSRWGGRFSCWGSLRRRMRCGDALRVTCYCCRMHSSTTMRLPARRQSISIIRAMPCRSSSYWLSFQVARLRTWRLASCGIESR